MADEHAPKSGRPRFWSRSKGNKAPKENDSPNNASPQTSPTFESDNIDAFLKPSRDAFAEKVASTKTHLAPKLNIAIARQWPASGNEVRLADAPSPPPAERFFYRKPTRRPGLSVTFSNVEPEIIGEGGDEASDPVSEVSRRKTMFPRSTSAKVPRALDDGSAWPGTAIPYHSRQQSQPEVEDPGRFTLRRAETSYGEMSPPMQGKHASPPPRQPPARTFGRELPNNMLAPEQAGASNLTVKKQRDMRNNEGMALRRASAMFMDEEEEDLDAPSDLPESPPPQGNLPVPSAALSMESLNSAGSMSPPDQRSSPFVDPKYLNRGHRPTASINQTLYGGVAAQQPQLQFPRPPRSPPSYMRSQAQPPVAAPPPNQEPTLPEIDPPITQEPTLPSLDIPTARQPKLPDVGVPVGPPGHHRQISKKAVPLQYNATAARSADHLPRPSDTAQNQQPPIPPRRHPGGLDVRPLDVPNAASPVGSLRAPFYRHQTQSSSSLNPRVPSRPLDGQNGSPGGSPGSRPSQQGLPYHRSTSSGSGPPGSSNSESLHPQPPVYARYPSKSPNYAFAPQTVPGSAAAPHIEQPEPVGNERPPLAASGRMSMQNVPSQANPALEDPVAEQALNDFAGRVEHMKGVFSLTAEKERPADWCTPHGWLRAALWWYLQGKIGLEILFRQRSQSSEPPRELLMQPHVDLAKALWIINGPLQQHHTIGTVQRDQNDSPNAQLSQGLSALQIHVRSLAAIMLRDNLMPPPASLIQGQDTRIWLSYTQFTPDAAASLCGSGRRPVTADDPLPTFSPLEALPPGDSQDVLCYGRFVVDVSLGTDDFGTDRAMQSCMLSICRGSREYQMGIVVVSQSELINIRIGGMRPSSTQVIGWHDVSWQSSSSSLVVRLPLGFDLTVRMKEQDFRHLWNLVEYARKLENNLRPLPSERLVHRIQLAEVQYADTSGTSVFPADKLRHCMLLTFEKKQEERTATRVLKRHCGYRVLLVTDTTSKVLSFVGHEVCRSEPLLFEFMTDAAAAHGETAMLLRINEPSRQCRMLLVFPDALTRQAFYDILNGLTVAQNEAIVAKANLTSMNIHSASQTDAFAVPIHPSLKGLQWAKLGITNVAPGDSGPSPTVNSDFLRVVARHGTGCITDRVNLGKGEMLFRLPCSPAPSIQLLREAQPDLAISIDSRYAPPQVVEGLTELLHVAQQQPTIRTLTFTSAIDLHMFQTALTGFHVAFDGVASTFSISRTMMVVSISHKWQASNARIQVLSLGALTQVVVFLEGFSHADSMCFRIKSTDVFEKVKGNNKDKKWAVKMKDAKFSLPKQEKSDMSTDDVLRSHYVNLDGLDYAEEHDDITVGFDTEDERDQFANALPAESKVGRSITLRRRI